jgi:hypothetical protein
LEKDPSNDMDGFRPIHCKDLPWTEGFPASYEWFQDNRTERPSLFAKPKTQGQAQVQPTAVMQEEESNSEPDNKRRRVVSARRSSRLTNRRMSYWESSDSDD